MKRNMKKILSVFLAILLITAITPMTFAEESNISPREEVINTLIDEQNVPEDIAVDIVLEKEIPTTYSYVVYASTEDDLIAAFENPTVSFILVLNDITIFNTLELYRSISIFSAIPSGVTIKMSAENIPHFDAIGHSSTPSDYINLDFFNVTLTDSYNSNCIKAKNTAIKGVNILNTGESSLAAASISGENIDIIDSNIIGSYEGVNGGGIVSIKNTTISNTTGNAIWISGGSLDMRDSEIYDNGSGIFVAEWECVISNSKIYDNLGAGLTISNYGYENYISGTEIYDNTVGIAMSGSGTLKLDYCEIYGGETGILSGNETIIDINGTTIRDNLVGIDADYCRDISLLGTTIKENATIGIQVKNNGGEVKLVDSFVHTNGYGIKVSGGNLDIGFSSAIGNNTETGIDLEDCTVNIGGNTAIVGNGSEDSEVGGGIRATYTNHDDVFVVNGCRIEDNYSKKDGGGIYIHYNRDSGSDINLDGNTISGNVSDGNGGGVYFNGAKMNYLYMAGGKIENNEANNGGGMYFENPIHGEINGYERQPEIIDVDIIDNFAFDNGGGIYSARSMKYQFDKIQRNSAYSGGGIYMTGDADYIEIGGYVADNYAWRDGGGIYLEENVQLKQNGYLTITENSANNYGGGIYTYIMNQLEIREEFSDISSNTARRGGNDIYSVR